MKQVVIVATAVVIVGLLTSCKPSQLEHSSSQLEWRVEIDQPTQQLEETLAKLEQQQPRNYTISNIAFLYDAKLYILFHEFTGKLSESARADEVKKQRQWLAHRKALVDKADAEYEGGTYASYNCGKASIAATKQRIAEIEQQLKQLPR